MYRVAICILIMKNEIIKKIMKMRKLTADNNSARRASTSSESEKQSLHFRMHLKC